ncbi:MAG: YidB family protein [Rhodanobacteraceae bacterium]
MSLLDSVIGDITGSSNTAANGSQLLNLAGGLIEKAGGISGLVSLFEQGGLGSHVRSWVSNGTNAALSGDQLAQTLQGSPLAPLLQEAAAKFGMDPKQLTGQLAAMLPKVVDHLTPDGEVPQPGQVQSGINVAALEGLASKLFGGAT